MRLYKAFTSAGFSIAVILFTFLNNTAKGGCEDFSIQVNKEEGCLYEVFTFTAENATAASSFRWVIGDDTLYRDEPSTLYDFTQAGTFDVHLRVTLPDSSICNFTEQELVKINPLPDPPVIHISDEKICDLSTPVQLSSPHPENMQEWNWVVGQHSYEEHNSSVINHQFNTPGYKEVSLQVRDENGCRSTTILDSAIVAYRAPDVDFDDNATSGCLPINREYSLSLEHTDTTYTLEDKNWSVDGPVTHSGTLQDNSFEVEFDERGSYNIFVEVEGSNGCTYVYEDTSEVNVGEEYDLKFEIDKPELCAKETAQLEITQPDTFSGNVNWDFGSEATILHDEDNKYQISFIGTGNFDGSLTVNDGGCISEYDSDQTVHVGDVHADFTVSPWCACHPPLEVQFTDESYGFNTEITSYKWEFIKDGTVIDSSTEKNPQVIFDESGRYTTSLTVEDSIGCTDSQTKDDSPSIIPLQANFSVETPRICPGTKPDINGPTKPFCTPIIDSFRWEFYDQDGQLVAASNDPSPDVTLHDTGFYDVYLYVEDEQGCFDENTKEMAIEVVHLEANLEIEETPAEFCQGSPISISDPASQYSTATIKDITWNFYAEGDTVPTYTFEGRNLSVDTLLEMGAYDVEIVVNTEEGCELIEHFEDLIAISGLKGDFTVNQTKGCTPLASAFDATIDHNFNVEGGHGSKEDVDYQWSVTPSNNVVITNQGEANTDIIFNENGIYSVTLTMTNEMECSDVVTYDSLIKAGVIADFELPEATCESRKMQVENSSVINPVSYDWNVWGSAELISPRNSKNPTINFKEVGHSSVSLIATNDIGCKDTTVKTIEVEPFRADFISPDTNGKCSPAHISFETEGTNADSFYWHFGDNTTFATRRTSFEHLYNLHSLETYRNYFDVEMIYMSDYGCQDTVRKEEYVAVYGPIAKMEILSNEGCDPHEVEFRDHSIEATRVFINYRDGTELDSTRFESHVYETQDKSVPYETFEPYIIATDEQDCHDAYFPEEHVTVYNNPVPDFSVDRNRGCAPLTVRFTGEAQLADVLYWDFNNNGQIDDTGFVVEHTFTESGHFDVRQIAENKYGCIADTVFHNQISVDDPPIAEIIPYEEVICYDDTITFNEASVPGTHPINSWEWYIEGPDTFTHILNARDTTFRFPHWGKYDVSLIVTDEVKCRDTATLDQAYRVQDTIPPLNKGIKYVTIEDDQYHTIQWYESGDPIFDYYSVRRDGNLMTTITDVNETAYVDQESNIHQAVNCYRISLTDQCGLQSEWSNLHCPVRLDVSSYDSVSNQLSWSHYQGWDSIREYEIYRQDDNGDYNLKASVPGSDTSYIDRNLCHIDYCYKVKAIHPSGQYKSLSNTDCNKPPYQFDDEPPYLTRTTVYENERILTEWEADKGKNFDHFLVKRYNRHGRNDNQFRIETPELIDNDVLVNETYYQYSVQRVDVCDNHSQVSNPGTSILLNSSIHEFDYAMHDWNIYETWPQGIREHVLQWENEEGNFVTLEQNLPPAMTYLEEDSPVDNIEDEHCYRLIAIKNRSDSIASLSNISCAYMPSRIFVPNAFSPNDDGTNDEFSVSALGIYNNTGDPQKDFRMQIFSRWGELIYESNDYNEAWNGKIGGTLAEEGVYIYSIQATGYDSKQYHLSGDVTLIR